MPYPPDKGDKIRSYREWSALARTHRVTLAFFVDDPADEVHLPLLRAQEGVELVLPIRLNPGRARLRSLLALPGRRPLSLAFYDSSALRRGIADAARSEEFDAVVAFSSTMGPYALQVPAARRILDLCDLDSQKWEQYAEASRFPMSWIYRTEARRLGAYEAEAAARFDQTLLVSAAEAAELERRAPKARVTVAGNGIDLGYYDPAHYPDLLGDGRTTVFCGAMDYKSNVDAVAWYHAEILPRVRERVPDARFRIVGSNPSPEVLRLGREEG
ncbi:MAG: sugar transferase, partial [Planctomycetes bacterium]|nr:sugar transferase [Planctomycetota bacterium]